MKRGRLLVSCMAMLLATGVTLPGWAQNKQQNRDDSRRSQTENRRRDRDEARERHDWPRDARARRRMDRSRRATASGRVVRTKKVGVRGARIEHLVVLLRTERGRTAAVDLGPVKRLDRVKIATGDRLVTTGDVIAVGDRPILMARSLQKDGKTKRIDRRRSDYKDRDRRKRDDHSRGRQQYEVLRPQSYEEVERAGQIVRTKKVAVRGQNREHMIVLLKSEDGKRRTADLGPVKKLDQLRLSSGDTITLNGRVARIGDRQVLMATSVQKEDGESVSINRRTFKHEKHRRSSSSRDRNRTERNERQRDRGDR